MFYSEGLCEKCGTPFSVPRENKRGKARRFCSRKCWPARLPQTEHQRELAKERNHRYYAGLSYETKLAKIRRDNERNKLLGWPAQTKFRHEHPDVIKATNAFRSALHRGSRGNKVMVKELMQRHGEWCGLCGLPLGDDITVDHLTPVAQGGVYELHNLTLAHKSCNSSKNDKDFVMWALANN